jgi:hypothetical protein
MTEDEEKQLTVSREDLYELRAEAARIQAEREKAVAQERARRQRLAAEANRWAQSIRIREYVEHIHMSSTGRPNPSADLNDWTKWALSVADEIDPTEARLCPEINESSVEPQE